MEKFYEKKNFGIPVIILNIIAYLIGYSLTQNLASTLLIAVLFALAVFSLQFDDRVKNAVKHSYIIAACFLLIYLAFNLFSSFISIFSYGRLPNISSFTEDYYRFGFLPRILTFLYTYGLVIVNIAVAVIFGLMTLMTILKRDINIAFVKKILGEVPPRQPARPQAPAYNPAAKQPVPPYGQQTVNPQVTPPYGQQAANPQVTPPFGQQAANPQAQAQASVPPTPAPQAPVRKPGVCPNCGAVNVSDARFCGSCGTKLV